MQMI